MKGQNHGEGGFLSDRAHDCRDHHCNSCGGCLGSYGLFVQRGHRAEAKSALLRIATILERNFTEANRYDQSSGGAATSGLIIQQSPTSGTAVYTIAVAANPPGLHPNRDPGARRRYRRLWQPDAQQPGATPGIARLGDRSGVLEEVRPRLRPCLTWPKVRLDPSCSLRAHQAKELQTPSKSSARCVCARQYSVSRRVLRLPGKCERRRSPGCWAPTDAAGQVIGGGEGLRLLVVTVTP